MPHPTRRPPAAAPLTVSRPELLRDGSDRAFRSLVHDLFGLFARHQAVRDGHAAMIGLAGTEYTVLISIAHLGTAGSVTVKTVADHLHVSGTFVTRVVKLLEKAGLVRKRISAQDRRRVHLTVTRSGHAALARLAPVQRRVNDVQFGTLSAREFETLSRLTQKLLASSDAALALQRRLNPRR